MEVKTMYIAHFKHKNDDKSGKREGGGEGPLFLKQGVLYF